VLLYKSLNERDYDPMWVPLLKVSFFNRCHTVSLLSSIFLLVFSSIKFDTGFIDKNYLLTILESMSIKIFSNSKNSSHPPQNQHLSFYIQACCNFSVTSHGYVVRNRNIHYKFNALFKSI
jgi:hypothetical protein